MIITWTKIPLNPKETYAKEKYVCELYDSKCELYLWHDDTWRAIDNVFECKLEAENLEDAIEETRQWFLKRVERKIEERREELRRIEEKLRKVELIKKQLENISEIEIKI